MKSFTLKVLLIALLTQVAIMDTNAQLNCDGLTNMYGLFINQARTNGNAYFAPLSYSTGAPGAMMLPGVFAIPRANTTAGSNAYGSTSLAVDRLNNRMFYMTADYLEKDLYVSNALTGLKTKIADLPASLNNYYFVKIAVGPNGWVYSLSTNRSTGGTPDTKLIRFNSCATANCATVEIIGSIPFTSFNANLLYNGDLAFDFGGNLYVFGSEIDPATSSYVKAAVFRINAADIPSVAGTVNVPITKIGDIPALDALVISGFALDALGNYYLATIDQTTRAVSSIYTGSIMGGTMSVSLLYSATIPGYIISDLASCSYPLMNLLEAASSKLNAFNRGSSVSLFWKTESISNLKTIIVEKQLENESDFKEIASVPYSASENDYQYNDENASALVLSSTYRLKFKKSDGTVSYSNAVTITNTEKLKTKVHVLGNPFIGALEFELTTLKPGLKNVVIVDQKGVQVYSTKVVASTGVNKIKLEKSANLKKGMYVLHVSDESDNLQFKILKQ